MTALAITKLDTLTGIEKLKVCVGYEKDGKMHDNFPASLKDLALCKPIYETLDGWNEDITMCKSYGELPENTKKYIETIEKISGIPAKIISVGPNRSETIIRDDVF
jgi:adenylosuccinate synthase